jgi:N utilization substance protein B
MATIHHARIQLVSILYAYDFVPENIYELKDELLDKHKIRNRPRNFADSTFEGILNNLNFIDEVIEKNLKNDLTIGFLGKLEKSILRLSTYELQFTNTDKPIIIDEALKLTQDFEIEVASKLINGVLDSVQ